MTRWLSLLLLVSCVGDKTNDSVRVDARELNCRVFSEGANLSITDRGRVELSRKGGAVYTAFLDNSVRFQATLTFLNARLQGLRTAIVGEPGR